MTVAISSPIKDRFVAAGGHLLISALLAAAAAGLVFGLWYPGPFRRLSGGQGLFWLIVSVDVVLGPLLTFVAFNRKKGWLHLRRDLALIAALQLVALIYGLHTVYAVRPVAIVFEVDRFRVVSAQEVYSAELTQAPAEYRRLPLTGPWLLSLREAKDSAEKSDALLMALEKGIDMGQRPRFWQPYVVARTAALARARPISVLMQKYPLRAAEFRDALADAQVPESDARFLPVVARGDWIAVLDGEGNIATYLAADAFF